MRCSNKLKSIDSAAAPQEGEFFYLFIPPHDWAACQWAVLALAPAAVGLGDFQREGPVGLSADGGCRLKRLQRRCFEARRGHHCAAGRSTSRRILAMLTPRHHIDIPDQPEVAGVTVAIGSVSLQPTG